VKGESIYAYVTLLDQATPTAKLHAELVNLVKTQIGSFAAPDVIHWVSIPMKAQVVLYRNLRRK
jgi:acetyl-CoA synthetase